MFYLKASVTPTLILFSLGFSFLVGCASGFMPARSASKLKPVEALRYE
jgi:ABC-type antimicrobial peptide transport system permease subunit